MLEVKGLATRSREVVAGWSWPQIRWCTSAVLSCAAGNTKSGDRAAP